MKAPPSTHLPHRGDVNPGLGGRVTLCAKGATVSVAAPTTGPSVRPAGRPTSHEQESVETRARVHEPNKEVAKTVQPGPGAQPTPNYLRPCVSLDVHKGSITATQMEPGGQVAKTWTLPTTRSEVLSLAQGIPTAVPVVLEASTAGKAVALVLKEKRMNKEAEELAPAISSEDLAALADRLSGEAEVLARLQEEAGDDGKEVADAG